jgi:hypothetical protein
MATKGKTDSELWAALEGLDDDLLDVGVSEQAIDDQLKSLGVDPSALGRRGAEFVTQAKDQERLAWQGEARARQAELRRRASGFKTEVPRGMTREAVLARLEELRTATPELGTAIRMAARKRKPEESSDDELRTLLEEMEALRAIEKEDRD